MAKTFEQQKFELKWANVKKINNDDDRLLKVKDVVATGGSLDPEEVKKLLKTVDLHDDSKLSSAYVEEQLYKRGQHVIVYNRNSDLLPDEEQGLPSAFMLYQLQQAQFIQCKSYMKNNVIKQGIYFNIAKVSGVMSCICFDCTNFLY